MDKQSFSANNKKILAKEWFDAAESDYQYAEVGLKEETVFPQIAFLCQQVAEKYLIEARYPPDIPRYTEDEIRQAFEQAKMVKETIVTV